MAEEIAQKMVEEDEEANADVIAGRLLFKSLPEWVSKGNKGVYGTLHVGEMKEILRLRGDEVITQKCMKPMLIE
jgi:hypothetical protein